MIKDRTMSHQLLLLVNYLLGGTQHFSGLRGMSTTWTASKIEYDVILGEIRLVTLRDKILEGSLDAEQL